MINIIHLLKHSKNTIPFANFALFYRQLATLMSAEIPIIQGFDILSQTQSHPIFQKLLIKIKMDLEAGNPLSFSISKYPRYFDTTTCHLILSGEQSGKLVTTLNCIAMHQEKGIAIKNKVRQACMYPMIVSIVAFLVTITMLTLVIPRFALLFQTMHSTLPSFTLLIIHLSDFIRHYYGFSLFPLCLFILTFQYAHTSKSIKNKIEQLVLKTPYFGILYMKLILSRFCRSLAITYSAGIPISESLNMIAYANGSDHYAQIILKIRLQIIKGQQLHQAMRLQISLPPLLIEMVKVGEESGTLDKMLEKIANIYESDLEHGISICSQLLEPLIMVILGVLIGGLVIAMYLPIFKLGTAI